jgi:hypothetical protein
MLSVPSPEFTFARAHLPGDPASFTCGLPIKTFGEQPGEARLKAITLGCIDRFMSNQPLLDLPKPCDMLPGMGRFVFNIEAVPEEELVLLGKVVHCWRRFERLGDARLRIDHISLGLSGTEVISLATAPAVSATLPGINQAA